MVKTTNIKMTIGKKHKVIDWRKFAMINGNFTNPLTRKQIDSWKEEHEKQNILKVDNVLLKIYTKIIELLDNHIIEGELKGKKYSLVNRCLYWDLIELLNKNKNLDLNHLVNKFERIINLCDNHYSKNVFCGLYKFLLGIMYLYEYGINKNKIYGEQLIIESALKNNTFGILFLIRIIESDQLSENNYDLLEKLFVNFNIQIDEIDFIDFLKKNKNEIIYKLYVKVLALGNMEGAYYLGNCYENSIGIEYDADKSRRFYKLAKHFYPNL